MFIRALLHGVLWGIWKERNKRIFEDHKKNRLEVIDSILCEVGSWLLVKKEFEDCSPNEFMRDWSLCISLPTKLSPLIGDWVPPPRGKVKVNFDEASFGNPGPPAYGCVVRDS